LSWCPDNFVAYRRQRWWHGWWNKSINTGVVYDWPLDCQVTIRYGVLYYRYWSAPVGCIKFIQLSNILFIIAITYYIDALSFTRFTAILHRFIDAFRGYFVLNDIRSVKEFVILWRASFWAHEW